MAALTERRARWFADLARAVEAASHDGAGVLVLDPDAGRIVATSALAEQLVGQPIPERARDLVECGLVARPDLEAFAARIAAWRSSQGARDREAAHAWSSELRVHPARRPSRRLRLDAVLHTRPVLHAEAVTVLVRPLEDRDRAVDPEIIDWSAWDLYDAEMRALALEAVQPDFGWAPAARFGLPVSGLLTPEDLRRVLPAALAVIEGRAVEAEYSLDLPRPGQPPLRMQSTLRRVDVPHGEGPDVRYLVRSVPTTILRDGIAPGVLTPRQEQAVRGVFAGRSASQIAAEQGVALPTIRTHLAAAYRRLGVSGRDELVARYHRPVTISDRTTVAVIDPASPPSTGRRTQHAAPRHERDPIPITERRWLETPTGHVEVAVTRLPDPSAPRRPLPGDHLAPREAQVVAALFEGLRSTAIAQRHGVTPKTVRKQLSAAYTKLGVAGRSELIATYLPPTSNASSP
jgi:DNA-binding CsgD family transcriptional regulator